MKEPSFTVQKSRKRKELGQSVQYGYKLQHRPSPSHILLLNNAISTKSEMEIFKNWSET